VPDVVARGDALPAGVPLMSLAEVVPLVVLGVVLPEESAFSAAVQALNPVSNEHKSAPESTESSWRFIRRRKCGKRGKCKLLRYTGIPAAYNPYFNEHKYVFLFLFSNRRRALVGQFAVAQHFAGGLCYLIVGQRNFLHVHHR